jgi:hypothetical protein
MAWVHQKRIKAVAHQVCILRNLPPLWLGHADNGQAHLASWLSDPLSER